MKNPIVFIFVLTLLVSSLSIPLFSLAIGTSFSNIPRQVDPATAPAEIVYGPGLFLFYGSVISLIDSGNFSGVRALLSQAGFIHIPPEISFSVNIFNGLLTSTANILAATNTELSDANSSISTGRVDEATSHVQTAFADLKDANRTITELVAAAPRLAGLTGMPISLFLPKVNTLVSLYAAYLARAHLLQDEITRIHKLVQTSLTLAVSQTAIETGSNVQASGTLTATSGAQMGSRSVTIFFQGSSLGQAVTDSMGHFLASIRTPYVYQQILSLIASYLPVGNDTKLYSPSSSPTVQLNVNFTSPLANVTAPGNAFAGLSLTVNGTLSADKSPLAGYGITLTAFGQDSSSKTTKGGRFSFEVVAPASLSGGTYSLTLLTSGNRTTGPLSQTIKVNVIKLDPLVTINVPAFVIAGFATTISGSAKVNGSVLQGATVLNVSPTPQVNTTSSDQGSFSFKLTPSLYVPTGEWDYTVGVYPQQSWISPDRVKVSLFVVNPAILIPPVLSAALLVMVVRKRRSANQTPILAAQEREWLLPPESVPVERRPGLAKTYFEALELVQRATSIILEPSDTLREYLYKVKGVLKGLVHFEHITLALESQLYGPGVAFYEEQNAEEEFDSLRRALET
jgi:hypothetical protein